MNAGELLANSLSPGNSYPPFSPSPRRASNLSSSSQLSDQATRENATQKLEQASRENYVRRLEPNIVLSSAYSTMTSARSLRTCTRLPLSSPTKPHPYSPAMLQASL